MAIVCDGDVDDVETGPCCRCEKMDVRTYGPLRRGWRFSPNDEELIEYLREKNADELLEIEEIPDVDICKFEPEDLPGKSLIKTDDLEWFFFSPFKRKYQRGCRKDRMTNTGYWKVTGKDRNIKSRSSKLIGKKRTLVFYEGRAPRCERTNWIAHEYQTIENGVDGKKCEEGAFVVYRVKKKLDGDANSNCNNVGNDFAPTMPFPDNTRVGNAVERFETPLNQGILESSDMPVERSAADETDGRLYPMVSAEGHCISRISAGVDGYDAEATEVETQVTTTGGLGSVSINSIPIDAFHAMLPNHTESSSEAGWQSSSKNAWRVALGPPMWMSRGIRSMEKTHRQCGDAEDHRVTAAIIVGRENGAVGTRVNGGLCSTELEEELEKRLATLQLADKTQPEASHNLEGKQKQIPSRRVVRGNS